MKLHALSDSHTEIADFEPPITGADMVVLAGGIGVGTGGRRVGSNPRDSRPETGSAR